MAPANGNGASNASAVDIITYIGIPLAVLGVIPTLYTCLKSFLTLRSIRKTLLANHVTAITRSSLLSGIIEVEIPRKSLCPLDRSDPSYFSLGLAPSTLKGGTWTLLNWREMHIGKKSYRLEYHDELYQPQAEIEFERLIAVLLDLGALPDPQGWEDLRGSGLWTPGGTRLMVSPLGDEAVLSVTAGDDSDGILSLRVYWDDEWPVRSVEDMPPYWMRLTPPIGLEGDDEKNHSDGDQLIKVDVPARADTEETLHESNASDVLGPNAPKRQSLAVPDLKRQSHTLPVHKRSLSRGSSVSATTYRTKRSMSLIPFTTSITSSIRIRLGPNGLEEATYESLPGKHIRLPHLTQHPHHPPSSTATLFASACTALSADIGTLWSYSIPTPLLALSQRESVPGAILVLLDLIPEDSVPAFRTPFDAKMAEHEEWVKRQKMMKRAQEQLRMTAEERAKHFHKQAVEDQFERQEELRRKEVEDERKREGDLKEALASHRVDISLVAEACISYLTKECETGILEGSGVSEVVEKILWEMLRDAAFASKLAGMLDTWQSWSEGGGMTKTHFEALRREKLYFAYAACVLCLIRDTAGSKGVSLVGDLQDCLRMWRKVRLG